MILRDLAKSWVQANCPRLEVQEDFLQRLDGALQAGFGCSFIIGHQLTKSGKSYLVYCYCGELFAFQLTPRQAVRLNVNDNMLVSARGLNQQNHASHPEPPVQLMRVQLDNSESHAHTARVTGSLSYRSDQWWMVPLAVQVVCEPPGRSSLVLFHHLENLPRGEGIVQFSFCPIGNLVNRQGQPFEGVMPLFFQVGIVGEPEISNGIMPHGAPSPATSSLPTSRRPPKALPPLLLAPPALGEQFVPSSPVPSLVTPGTMSISPQPFSGPLTPQSTSVSQRFRAISDIRAVLVEVE